MKCPRCKRIMIKDRIDTLAYGAHNLTNYRCITCGEVIDEIIVENRGLQRGGAKIAPKSTARH